MRSNEDRLQNVFSLRDPLILVILSLPQRHQRLLVDLVRLAVKVEGDGETTGVEDGDEVKQGIFDQCFHLVPDSLNLHSFSAALSGPGFFFFERQLFF